jgi:hypothetical protein
MFSFIYGSCKEGYENRGSPKMEVEGQKKGGGGKGRREDNGRLHTTKVYYIHVWKYHNEIPYYGQLIHTN